MSENQDPWPPITDNGKLSRLRKHLPYVNQQSDDFESLRLSCNTPHRSGSKSTVWDDYISDDSNAELSDTLADISLAELQESPDARERQCSSDNSPLDDNVARFASQPFKSFTSLSHSEDYKAWEAPPNSPRSMTSTVEPDGHFDYQSGLSSSTASPLRRLSDHRLQPSQSEVSQFVDQILEQSQLERELKQRQSAHTEFCVKSLVTLLLMNRGRPHRPFSETADPLQRCLDMAFLDRILELGLTNHRPIQQSHIPSSPTATPSRKSFRGSGGHPGFMGSRLALGDRDLRDHVRSAPNSESTEAALERIDNEAKRRRSAANQRVATCSWSGTLVAENRASSIYANKVFVGGLPYDVTPESLEDLFRDNGVLNVQFPPRGRGHAYLVFEDHEQVKNFLDTCQKGQPGQFFHYVPSRRGKGRLAQVIPWALGDSEWPPSGTDPADGGGASDHEAGESGASPSSPGRSRPGASRNGRNMFRHNTVFVGALHGEITAEGLQKIFSELFGPVVYVGIDSDKNRYPNGSARVTFETAKSFRDAVLAEFVQVVTARFTKTIQLDAYIEEGFCCVRECGAATPVFCRHPTCFRYYCPTCFEAHRRVGPNGTTFLQGPDYHAPVMRNRSNAHSNSGASGNHSSSHGHHLAHSDRHKDRSHLVDRDSHNSNNPRNNSN